MFPKTHSKTLGKTTHSTMGTNDMMTKGDKGVPHKGNGTHQMPPDR